MIFSIVVVINVSVSISFDIALEQKILSHS